MSEDFLFTDGTNPSALLDILDEDVADVNTSFDVDKILAKFIEPTLKKCKYDHDRWAKSILKFDILTALKDGDSGTHIPVFLFHSRMRNFYISSNISSTD